MGNSNQEGKNTISRYKSREQAFILCFEKIFNDYSITEICEDTLDCRDIEIDSFAIELADGVQGNISQIDELISQNIKKGWKISRISKVSLSILRLAVYEMLYVESVPISVSINEAVELAKKYSSPDDSGFVNGVLGAIAKLLDTKGTK